MKPKLFRVIESSEYTSAMAYVMALFDVGQVQANEQADLLLSSQKVEQNGESRLITKLEWQDGDGKHELEQINSCVEPEERKNAHKRIVQKQVLQLMENLTQTHPNPWGILRGVRPVKILQALLDEGLKVKEAQKVLEQEYCVDSPKATLAAEVAIRERPVLEQLHSRQISLYIGIPFCPTRCLYCSFPAYPLPKQAAVDEFLQVLWSEINHTAQLIAQHHLEVQSIYVGGGTPTALNNKNFTELLANIKAKLVSPATREFTVEAGRPDSLNPVKARAMARHGVTRVSINPQTMQEKTLIQIGRNHTVSDIIDTFGYLRQISPEKPFSINMDLIVGLPGENLQDLKDTLQKIEALQPDHLTVHTLAIKRASKLREKLDQAAEASSLASAAELALMVEEAARSARRQGLQPYYLYRQKNMPGNLENVGYAKPGHECLYNIQIMEERQTILALGASASTKIVWPDWQMVSLYNPKDLKTYIHKAPVMMQQRKQALAERFSAD